VVQTGQTSSGDRATGSSTVRRGVALKLASAVWGQSCCCTLPHTHVSGGGGRATGDAVEALVYRPILTPLSACGALLFVTVHQWYRYWVHR
jgi:hypothetical protein